MNHCNQCSHHSFPPCSHQRQSRLLLVESNAPRSSYLSFHRPVTLAISFTHCYNHLNLPHFSLAASTDPAQHTRARLSPRRVHSARAPTRGAVGASSRRARTGTAGADEPGGSARESGANDAAADSRRCAGDSGMVMRRLGGWVGERAFCAGWGLVGWPGWPWMMQSHSHSRLTKHSCSQQKQNSNRHSMGNINIVCYNL